jgi:uncharacterized membrane protein
MSINPWDPRTAIFAKHAQHVVLIHFPIALFITGVVFDFAAAFTRRNNNKEFAKELASVAYYNFCGALLAAIPAVLTGLLAWQLELEGRRLKGILLLHLIFGCTSLVLIAAVWWSHRKINRASATSPAWLLTLEALAVGVVAITGHLGGFLSGVNHP